MKRFLRILFNAATALSLMLCVATVMLWVRSYWVDDRFFARYQLSYVDFASYRGEVGCEFGAVYGGGPQDLYMPSWVAGFRHVPVDRVPESDYIHISEAQGRFKNMPHYHGAWGFRWHPRSDRDWEYRERGIAAPAWCIAAMAAALPAWRLVCVVRRSNRQSRGFCHACGYDLRATPGRCPECGRIP